MQISQLKNGLYNRIKIFARNKRASVGVIFGLLSIPGVMFVALTIDYSRANGSKSVAQGATDGAAFSIAANHRKSPYKAPDDPNSPDTKMQAFKATALSYLQGAISKNPDAKVLNISVQIANKTVIVNSTHSIPTTFKLPFLGALEISTQSKVEIAPEPVPACLVALDPSAPDAFSVSGTADLNAPGCAIYANSNNNTAMTSTGTGKAIAKKFCRVGGSSGTGFSPAPTQCPKVDDPYAGKFTPSNLKLIGGCDYKTIYKVKKDATISDMGAGVRFCEEVTILAGATVTFGPGIYVFEKVFNIKAGASVIADQGTTFVFVSDTKSLKGYLTVQAGGNLNLVAPKTGELTAFAMIHYAMVKPATDVNTIIGGGTINIVGIIYSPDADVRVTGAGTINANSKYFGIMAKTVHLEGNGVLNLIMGNDFGAEGFSASAMLSDANAPMRLTQ